MPLANRPVFGKRSAGLAHVPDRRPLHGSGRAARTSRGSVTLEARLARRRLRGGVRPARSCSARASLPDSIVRADPPRARSRAPSRAACPARVMSGCRTCGSSIGSASKTISDEDPVTLNDGLGELEQRALLRVAEVHGQRCSPLWPAGRGRGSRSSTKQKLRVCGRRRRPSRGLPSSAWRRKVGIARPSCGRMRGP